MDHFNKQLFTYSVDSNTVFIVRRKDTDYRRPQNDSRVTLSFSQLCPRTFTLSLGLNLFMVIRQYFQQPLKATGMRSEKFSLFPDSIASLCVNPLHTARWKFNTNCVSVNRFLKTCLQTSCSRSWSCACRPAAACTMTAAPCKSLLSFMAARRHILCFVFLGRSTNSVTVAPSIGKQLQHTAVFFFLSPRCTAKTRQTQLWIKAKQKNDFFVSYFQIIMPPSGVLLVDLNH